MQQSPARNKDLDSSKPNSVTPGPPYFAAGTGSLSRIAILNAACQLLSRFEACNKCSNAMGRSAAAKELLGASYHDRCSCSILSPLIYLRVLA